MAAFGGIVRNEWDDWSGSDVKFGDFRDVPINVTRTAPMSIVLGIIGGLLGAFFINVNTRMNECRKVLLTSKWSKPLETFFFSFMTASSFYYLSYALTSCVDVATLPGEKE